MVAVGAGGDFFGDEVDMRAVLHIGGEKTGTTTIQHFCTRNRAALAEAGFYYPVSLGAPNHVRLTAYALDDEKRDDLRLDLGIRNEQDLAAFRDRLRSELTDELRQAPAISTLLMSNEHIQSRLMTLGELERLRAFVRKYADDIKIIIYLRRQDRLAVSYYSTLLKAGDFGARKIFPEINSSINLPIYYDYCRTIDLFEDVFGVENIIVRVFEQSRFKNNDLIADFRDACEIPERLDLADVPRRNESLSEVGLRFFDRYNQQTPRFIDGRPNPRRDDGLIPIMTRRYGGRGPKASKADAEAFYAHFADGNRILAHRYFPDSGGVLFNSDFHGYAEGPPTQPSEDELLDLAIYLWQERTAEIGVLRLEIALLKFAAAARRDPDGSLPALPDVMTLEGLTPAVLLEVIGAFLYSGDWARVIPLAERVLAVTPGRTAFALALGVALLKLGDDAGFADLLARGSTLKRLTASLASLRSGGVAAPARGDWLAALRGGDELQVDMHAKCFGWLET